MNFKDCVIKFLWYKMKLYVSGNEITEEGCDSAVGFDIIKDNREIDGGELEYDSTDPLVNQDYLIKESLALAGFENVGYTILEYC